MVEDPQMNEKTKVEFIFYANQNVDRIVLDLLVKPIVQDIEVLLEFARAIFFCPSKFNLGYLKIITARAFIADFR